MPVSAPKGTTVAVLPATQNHSHDQASGERPLPLQPGGWPRPRGYANGMMAEGRLVLTGGVVGWDVAGQFPDSFVAQVRQTLENIVAILAEGGARPDHLMRLTWYVVDMEEYVSNLKAIGEVYRDVIGAHYPTMALVQVVRLVEPAARLEIEATAVVGSGR
jgi:enamine deaminase RidA (YjgF/YER057c/UK114 family)